jgi:hypothetical protein
MTRLIVLFGLFFLGDTTAVSAQAADYTDHMRTAISLNQQLVQQSSAHNRLTQHRKA